MEDHEPTNKELLDAMLSVYKELGESRKVHTNMLDLNKKKVFWQTLALCVILFLGVPFIGVIMIAV